MIRSKVSFNGETYVDLYDEYKMVHVETDDYVNPPIKEFESTSYADQDGDNIYPFTVTDPFDYKITLLVTSNSGAANGFIGKFNSDCYTTTSSGAREYRKIWFYNKYKGIIIVGYPTPISKSTTFWRDSNGNAQDVVQVELTIHVTDPTECSWAADEPETTPSIDLSGYATKADLEAYVQATELANDFELQRLVRAVLVAPRVLIGFNGLAAACPTIQMWYGSIPPTLAAGDAITTMTAQKLYVLQPNGALIKADTLGGDTTWQSMPTASLDLNDGSTSTAILMVGSIQGGMVSVTFGGSSPAVSGSESTTITMPLAKFTTLFVGDSQRIAGLGEYSLAPWLQYKIDSLGDKVDSNIYGIEFDRTTGKIYAVTEGENNVLTGGTIDRTTGQLTLSFDY